MLPFNKADTMQRTAKHCNTLKYAATHRAADTSSLPLDEAERLAKTVPARAGQNRFYSADQVRILPRYSTETIDGYCDRLPWGTLVGV